jgi:hypothetical protein
MKKITTLALVAAFGAVAACGNDVDVTTDTATVPAIDTTSGFSTPPTTVAPLGTDTTLRPDTLDTLRTTTP